MFRDQEELPLSSDLGNDLQRALENSVLLCRDDVIVIYIRIYYEGFFKYEVPFLRYDTALPVVPTVQEINAIIDSIVNIKHKAEIALLYSSGIRVDELCRLHCRDILRSRGCIFIARSKNRFVNSLYSCASRVKRLTILFLNKVFSFYHFSERRMLMKTYDTDCIQDVVPASFYTKIHFGITVRWR